MVVRQEEGGIKRYVHLATGNYHHTTVPYTDLGLLTVDDEIGADAASVFNMLTGYAETHGWRKLAVAPGNLYTTTMDLIRGQAERARSGVPSRIFAKINSLTDRNVIEALYDASQDGVPIELVVSGVCTLRPGLPGISENIRVRSFVDKYYEHSRMFVFGPDEDARVFLSSADWMPRNFHRRLEVMFPIDESSLQLRILRNIIPAYLSDAAKVRFLQPDGAYTDVDRCGESCGFHGPRSSRISLNERPF
jgi:polyphosphate kinase